MNNVEDIYLDDRIYQTLKLIENSLKINKNYKINTIMLVWISDRFPWYMNIDKKLPIFVYAKPKNSNFLIFPDNTFYCLQLFKKYNGECNDFDIVKERIDKIESELRSWEKIGFKTSQEYLENWRELAPTDYLTPDHAVFFTESALLTTEYPNEKSWFTEFRNALQKSVNLVPKNTQINLQQI